MEGRDLENTGQKQTPKMMKFQGSEFGKTNRSLSVNESPLMRSSSLRKPREEPRIIATGESKTVTIPQQDSVTLDKFFTPTVAPTTSTNNSLDFDDIKPFFGGQFTLICMVISANTDVI